MIPVAKFGPGMSSVLQWLPSTALSDGLRAAAYGDVRWASLAILAAWAAAALAAAARWFRWE